VATLEGPSALAASVTVIAAAPVELLPLEAPPASAAEPAKADHSATIRAVAVLARDPFGNPVGNLRVLWSAAAPSGQMESAETVTGVDGIARTNWDLKDVRKGRTATLSAIVADIPAVTLRFSERR